ncbi:radical SAM protein [Methanobrevibacter sp.]|uniref:radical SAM protein n=1 Tax=Methanobrevibacter sp. TaxID=66852 RepID=UPI0026E06669|nr:radical SAM protein [Methanobrevibacter sp.]
MRAMNMNKVNVSKISRLRTYSDGDGVSTLIGCMGCPLRCAYCINPFSWDDSVKPKKYTLDELYDEVKKDHIYFLATGGGLVFGGGEPLLHHKFIKEFISKYKSTGWKFTLETSLSTKQEFLKDIIDCIDYFIVDTKDMDKMGYELYTKGDYDLFISNLKYLLANVEPEKIRVRVPKIPKFNTDEDIKSDCEKLQEMGFKNIEFFNYIETDEFQEISVDAYRYKKEFEEKVFNLQYTYVKKYIISEILLKIAPILNFHMNNFPDGMFKRTEFIFEYDSIYNDEFSKLKEIVISKLQKCFDSLELDYNFFVVLYPINHLSNVSIDKSNLDELNKIEPLKLWEIDKYNYLEFKFSKRDVMFDNIIAEIDSKYILSNAYEVLSQENKIKVYLKREVIRYNIVEKEEATHILIQEFDDNLNLITQEIQLLND